jgi:hypothetical protein
MKKLYKVLVRYSDRTHKHSEIETLETNDSLSYHMALIEGWSKTKKSAQKNYDML